MSDCLLDTGIIILHLRDRPPFQGLLRTLALQNNLWIASLTRVEVISGMREHERQRTALVLNRLQSHALDTATADLAGELMRSWRGRGYTLHVPDAVIGASALRLGADLITTNPKDFPFDGLRVHSVDAQGHLIPIR